MNKEEVLLKNYSILSKKPQKYRDALQSALEQLMALNPKLGFRCWEECIRNNISEIQQCYGKSSFDFSNIGYMLIYECETKFCASEYFIRIVEEYARNRTLMDVIYAKSPLSTSLFSGEYAISYLIRKNHFQEANNILSAVYKNKTFKDYAGLWNFIIKKFEYGDLYHPSSYIVKPLISQPDDVRTFCIEWIERIRNKEEQAGAMTYAMQMFESNT